MDANKRKATDQQYRLRRRQALDQHKQLVLAVSTLNEENKQLNEEVTSLQQKVKRYRYLDTYSDDDLDRAITYLENG